MRKWLAWLQASRLASQTYILFPLLAGTGFFFVQTRKLAILPLVLTLGFSISIQLFIVYANDYADREVDLLNTTFNLFSGGSRVLVEGKLTLEELRRGIWFTMGMNILVAAGFSAFLDRHGFWLVLPVSWGLLWAYSYPPFRVSYRGGGEWLQAAGVGVVLPLAGYYAQSGGLGGFPWGFLAGSLPLHYAAALTTTLPDEPSDRKGQKRTGAVRWGVPATIMRILLIYCFSLLVLGLWYSMSFNDSYGISILGLPALGLSGLFSFRRQARPGNRAMDWFVTCGVAVTVLLMLGLCVSLFFP